MVGSPGVLPQSDTEAFLWAEKAAEAGLVKAMYAVGYFLEVGIGTPADLPQYVFYFSLVLILTKLDFLLASFHLGLSPIINAPLNRGTSELHSD